MTVHVQDWPRNNFGPEHGVDGNWNFKVVLEDTITAEGVRSVPDIIDISDNPAPTVPISQVGDELWVSVVVNLGAGGIVETPPSLGTEVDGDFPDATGTVINVAIDEIRWGRGDFQGPNQLTGPNVFDLTVDGVDAFPYYPEYDPQVRGANVGGSLLCTVTAIVPGTSATIRPHTLDIPFAG